MTYDFDTIIDRRGSGAVKTDALTDHFGQSDLTALWVADMDFATPPFIIDALRQRLQHPILGYTVEPTDYRPAIVDWLRKLHGWEVNPDWLTYIPGIVKGIGLVINRFVAADEKVIIQTPVYHPFRLVPEGNGRKVVGNPLRELPYGGYEMDFDNLETLASDSKTRLLILSNPHNPAGIVWSPETLRRVADICYRNNVLVISDEIHSEMPLFGNRHTPFATVSPEARACSITFAAPSKTFNIAGVVSSYAIVPDDKLREQFYSWLTANELNAPDIFAPIATIAAYRLGDNWRREMLAYVEQNVEFTVKWFAENMPQVKPLSPQASFLVWLDCRGLNLSHEDLMDLFVNRARLALNDGAMFGDGGKGFMRLNVGCPRKLLSYAFEKLSTAYER